MKIRVFLSWKFNIYLEIIVTKWNAVALLTYRKFQILFHQNETRSTVLPGNCILPRNCITWICVIWVIPLLERLMELSILFRLNKNKKHINDYLRCPAATLDVSYILIDAMIIYLNVCRFLPFLLTSLSCRPCGMCLCWWKLFVVYPDIR